MRISKDGSISWVSSVGGNDEDSFNDVCKIQGKQGESNTFVAVGKTWSYQTGICNSLIVKFNQDIIKSSCSFVHNISKDIKTSSALYLKPNKVTNVQVKRINPVIIKISNISMYESQITAKTVPICGENASP